MRNPIAFAVLLATAVPAAGIAQQIGETIEVRVANIDVVVTDRAGKPIQGLTKDDFELLENGKPQGITNFSEIRSAAEAVTAPATATMATTATSVAASDAQVVSADVRPRSFVIFIDNSAIDPMRRNQAIDKVIAAIDSLVRPSDDAMVVAWNRRAEILQDFTRDRAALKRSLESSRKISGTASIIPVQKEETLAYARGLIEAVNRGVMTAAIAYRDSVEKARAYAHWMLETERLLFHSLDGVIAAMSGIDGKKVLLFVGGELQQNPGLDLFQAIDSMFLSLTRNVTPAAFREGELNTSLDVARVAKTANANGVTMYMIDVNDRSRGNAEATTADAEIDFTTQANTYISMLKLASNTGGAVLSGSSNFSSILQTVSRDLSSYYSLGYKPAEGPEVRRISVRVKRSGAIARTRYAYTMKTPEQQLQDRLLANAYHDLRSDFPVTIATSTPESAENGLYKVKVTLTFPASFTYLKQDDKLRGEYAVYIVTTSEDGTVSPVGKQVQPLSFPLSAEETLKQMPFTHSTGLVLKPGAQTISVAVVDRAGARTGFAKTHVTPH